MTSNKLGSRVPEAGVRPGCFPHMWRPSISYMHVCVLIYCMSVVRGVGELANLAKVKDPRK